MKIWLDDQLDDPELPARHAPEGWVGAKSSEEFKRIVTEARERGEGIKNLELDNDLGGNDEGFRLLEWLKEFWPEVLLKSEIAVHSKNQVRKEWMENFIRHCRENPQEVLEFRNRPSYEDLFGELEKLK
jgi:hypothetical protein